MKVPLLLYSFEKTVHIVKNSQLLEYDFPFNPYILYPNREGSYRYRIIPTGKEIRVGRREYNTTFEANSAASQLNKEKAPHYYLQYNEQLFIDEEDYVLDYANTDDLKILYFDIETASYGNGLFPRAKTNPILAIGCKFNNEEIKIFDNYSDEKEDAELIDNFLDYVKDNDIDIMIGYNSKNFDIPYIVERCKIKQLNYNKLGRFGSSIFNRKNEIVIKHRIHFDLYDHIVKDQTLMGIKSHKMKDVAIWKKLPNVIELEDHEIKNTWKVFTENKERLIEYLKSDVEITYQLSKGYLNNCVNLAEFIKVPLDNIINTYPSFIPKIICGRQFNKLGYIPIDRNHERYNDQTGKYYQTGFKYQGAVVGINKKGYFPKTYKVDFSSQYPSSIVTWNLGPDTTKIMSMEDYIDEYEVKVQKDFIWIKIPDDNFNKRVVIRIDQTKEGFLKKYIKDLFKLRKELKAKEREAKEAGNDAEKERYYSQQWAVKVVLNTIYGFMGNEFANFGDMATALTITGCCRWTINCAQKFIEDSIIEIDTDGLYIDKEINIDDLNKGIADKIKKTFGVESAMIMELEEFDESYFYKMKNYILKEEGKIVRHGVSFKSSRHPGIYDKAITKLSKEILDSKGVIKQEIIDEVKDLSRYDMNDFIMRVKLNKDPKSYDNPNASQGILMDQMRHVMKKSPEMGDQIEHYITVDPAPVPAVLKKLQLKKTKGYNYTISQLVENRSQLDMEYYDAEIEKVIKLFKGEEDQEENDN